MEIGANIMPKVKSRITGGVDNTKNTLNNIVSTVKTGSPAIIDIPKTHRARFARLNRELIGM